MRGANEVSEHAGGYDGGVEVAEFRDEMEGRASAFASLWRVVLVSGSASAALAGCLVPAESWFRILLVLEGDGVGSMVRLVQRHL